eukprot:scaffold2500_cov176-Amphora_coffeaeformis.AAC.14
MPATTIHLSEKNLLRGRFFPLLVVTTTRESGDMLTCFIQKLHPLIVLTTAFFLLDHLTTNKAVVVTTGGLQIVQ